MEDKIFKLHDQEGLPIEIIATLFIQDNKFWNWKNWMKIAIQAGWSYNKIAKTIENINNDIFGVEWQKYRAIIPKMYLDIMDGK